MGNVYNFKGKATPALEEVAECGDFQEYSKELKAAMIALASYTYTLHINEIQVDRLNELIADHGEEACKDGYSNGFKGATSLWIETTMLLLERYGVKSDRLSIELMDECLTEVMKRRKEDAE